MSWRLDHIAAGTLALLITATPASAVVLTGEVRSANAQDIFTPPSMSSPVVLRFYVPEGTRVKKGDPLLSIDAGQSASQLRKLGDQIEQAQDKTAKEVADLQLKEVDAEVASVDAEAAYKTAAIDAAIPKRLISTLDYEKYQGTYKSTRRDVALKKDELAAARAAVARRRKNGALQAKKSQLQLAFYQAQVDSAAIHATMAGVVIHAFEGQISIDNGTRYEEGSTSYPGTKVGEVVDASGRSIRAWALEPDRRGLKEGQQVRLYFDALPGVHVTGRIEHIAGASESKPQWGDGRYYTVDIKLGDGAGALDLLPGMSVRIQTDLAAPVRDVVPAPPNVIKANGDIEAQSSITISPPAVEGLWQMNVTQMAPDGSRVKKGQPIVTFAAGTLAQQLPAKQSELAEKQRTQENLRLELADRARTTRLAVAKAKADLVKAERKTRVPKETIAAIKYKKLLTDRRKAEQHLALAEKRARIDAKAREAAQRVADDDVKRLKREVKKMRSSLASLTITAPRDGIFLHHALWNGDMIDTGSQVWRGMSVGDIPDMQSLAVHASLPERDLGWVRKDQRVRVVLTGGSTRVLDGKIERIGNTVHSESRVDEVPVVDLLVALNSHAAKLKPGQPVRVDIKPVTEAKP